ncbi:MAG: rRNA adenine N-6-methyltransferase family protein [Nanoarchaeota archaeon]
MKPKEFLKAFVEDCKYYDLEKKEIKTILNNINIKGKTILDIGTGVGRLSFPLSEYAKEVIALDSDKRLKDYFKEHRKRNIKFVNQSLEKFLRKKKKFDVILLAWPTINFKFIKLVKKAMNRNTKFVFITCYNNSDFETIIGKLDTKKDFDKDIENKSKFIENLLKKFKVIVEKKINTNYIYPNEKIAFRAIKNAMILWFNIKFNKRLEKKLIKIIKKHKKSNKIIFGEKIYFYILTLK